MLVDKREFTKQAFLGSLIAAPFNVAGSVAGSVAGFGAKGLLKGGWWGLKNAVKHPVKAMGIAGTGYNALGTVSERVEQVTNAASTPYRYF